MELKEAKEKIKIESADPVVNAWVLEHIRKDDDCFGKNFKETHPECQVCDILSSIDGRKEPVKVFCREILSGIPENEESGIVAPPTESGHDMPRNLSNEKGEEKMNKSKMIRDLLKEGKADVEIVAIVAPLYVTEGKSSPWATKRVNFMIGAIKKEIK